MHVIYFIFPPTDRKCKELTRCGQSESCEGEAVGILSAQLSWTNRTYAFYHSLY